VDKLNLLGSYIWKRMQKDNPLRRRTHPQEYITGLFINADDIQRYINDYINYGIDYTGDDNISAEDKIDKVSTKIDKISAEDKIERYWDFPDGKEK
tara:strand:+ start:75 stop:362 length:288 start_codon:yes stop_codon:yes gene_type:complete